MPVIYAYKKFAPHLDLSGQPDTGAIIVILAVTLLLSAVCEKVVIVTTRNLHQLTYLPYGF